MAVLRTMTRGNYTNKNAVENVIRYVTRTRAGEDRFSELVSFGGMGVTMLSGAEDMFKQFLYVQNVHNIETRKGRRIFHEVFSLTYEDVFNIKFDMAILDAVARECCEVYYLAGFQVVYAIHYEPKKYYHIHFVINSINFENGLKWHTNFSENKQRERIIQNILKQARCIVKPVEFGLYQYEYFNVI